MNTTEYREKKAKEEKAIEKFLIGCAIFFAIIICLGWIYEKVN